MQATERNCYLQPGDSSRSLSVKPLCTQERFGLRAFCQKPTWLGLAKKKSNKKAFKISCHFLTPVKQSSISRMNFNINAMCVIHTPAQRGSVTFPQIYNMNSFCDQVNNKYKMSSHTLKTSRVLRYFGQIQETNLLRFRKKIIPDKTNVDFLSVDFSVLFSVSWVKVCLFEPPTPSSSNVDLFALYTTAGTAPLCMCALFYIQAKQNRMPHKLFTPDLGRQ